jgi:hypothetical protein
VCCDAIFIVDRLLVVDTFVCMWIFCLIACHIFTVQIDMYLFIVLFVVTVTAGVFWTNNFDICMPCLSLSFIRFAWERCKQHEFDGPEYYHCSV